jgi:two-component system, OmpR family, sensor histidine kinase CpxA
MKVRFPLLAKILAWFFLNLVVLAAVFYVVFSVQLRLGLDSLLAGRAGERIRAVSQVIVDELKGKPIGEWGGVLKNFESAYKVQFYLFRNDGTPAAGEAVALPREVAEKITERRPGDGLGRGPPPGRGLGRRSEIAASPPQPTFVLHTGQPARYWVGVRLPLTDDSQSRPCPIILLFASQSLRAGGLFFDVTPWVVVGFGALICSVLFWIPLVRSVTRSISQMTQATEQIAEGRFDARVEESRGDELGRLGQAINRMAGRLAGFVAGQKRFLGDTAHELCSPIARMQVALGILEDRADGKQKAYVADVREEVEHISNLVNELLAFSKAGLQQKEVRLEPVNIASIARRVIGREVPGEGQVQTQIDDQLAVLAEPELLARALANLIRNAVRYAGSAGPIKVSAEAKDGQVAITVTDQGPGVPEQALQQIFDPFFRGEPSRSRETGGIGLGLAIVKTCVEACQGTVTARNCAPSGLQVEMLWSAASVSI